jgi:hypothetical protein
MSSWDFLFDNAIGILYTGDALATVTCCFSAIRSESKAGNIFALYSPMEIWYALPR